MRTTISFLSIAGMLLTAACSTSSASTSASSTSTSTAEPAKTSVAAASASAKPAPPPDPADVAFFKGELPASVKLTLGGSSYGLGFTLKRPEDWQYAELPGGGMLLISKDNSIAILADYPGPMGDEDGVRATLKRAPIIGDDYKQLSKNADVEIGPTKWTARTGYGTAKMFDSEGEVYWMRKDATLFVVAVKKGASKETVETAKAIARSMTAPKAPPN